MRWYFVCGSCQDVPIWGVGPYTAVVLHSQIHQTITHRLLTVKDRIRSQFVPSRLCGSGTGAGLPPFSCKTLYQSSIFIYHRPWVKRQADYPAHHSEPSSFWSHVSALGAVRHASSAKCVTRWCLTCKILFYCHKVLWCIVWPHASSSDTQRFYNDAIVFLLLWSRARDLDTDRTVTMTWTTLLILVLLSS
jgi:hypothetical protein